MPRGVLKEWGGIIGCLLWHLGWLSCAIELYLLHGLRSRRKRNFPKQGPAILAANHLSFLDPPILQVPPRRRVHFMAQGYLFRVPVLGWLIRIYGAFPVESDSGRDAYRSALAVLQEGKIFGIHPEGGRGTDEGTLQPFREGVARLAVRTGAPIHPATIIGSGRAWPRGQPIPKPGRITVTYYPPIQVEKGGGKEAAARIGEELRQRIQHRLGPAVRAFRRLDDLHEGPAPYPRVQEILPLILGIPFFAFRTGLQWGPELTALGLYGIYLLGDVFLWPQGRWPKYIRGASPILLLGALVGMEGGLLPLAIIAIPAAIQALWSDQVTGSRWVLGTVLTSIGGFWLGWDTGALALITFFAGHGLTSRRAPAGRAISLAYVACGLALGCFGLGGLQDVGMAIGVGGAAVVLSRLVPSRSLSRRRRRPPPDRPDHSLPGSTG